MPARSTIESRGSLELPFGLPRSDPTAHGPAVAVQFRLEEFEGPLDLLLHLIHRAEVSIYDIPIAAITDQYLQYLNAATPTEASADGAAGDGSAAIEGIVEAETDDREEQAKQRLEDLTQFHVMAATLLQIKSRMLLPQPYNDAEPSDDPRRELVERLLEYQKYKRLSELLAEQQLESNWIITRVESRAIPGDAIVEPVATNRENNGHTMSAHELLAYYEAIVASIGGEQVADLYEEFTVNEKIALVHEKLEQAESFPFAQLVRGESSVEIICAFWAVLELAKGQAIQVIQRKLFAPIRVERRAAAAAAAPAAAASAGDGAGAGAN